MNEEPRNVPLPSERRLAAIVFTDVVGYSARMQRDETGTMALVRVDFAVMRQLCTRHGGEILKSTGDGLLLCFASVVQAVACALKIQAEFSNRKGDTLQHRIGIHLGDIFREGGDVAGDGVNIAARLQTKARPGTICLSQSVYDAVKGKLPMQVESLGPQQLKNITEPITVYLAAPTGFVALMAVAKRSRAGWLVGAALVVAAALTVIFWPRPAPEAPALEPVPPSEPEAVPVAQDKSIAVLPFTNMSEDKENAFFADGVHEDLLTNLANIGTLKVISRTSMMQYRGTTKTIRQIASELGVAYILEGSVRRAGNQIRVTGQLIDARTDEHLWAKNYDGDLTDVFALQSKLSAEIAAALKAVISPQENTRLDSQPTINMAAYELYLKGRGAFQARNNSRDLLAVVQPLFTQSVKLDPGFAQAWVWLARVHIRIYNTIDHSAARLAQAKQCIDTAVRLAPEEPDVMLGLGNYYEITNDLPKATKLYQQVVQSFPNNAEALNYLGSESRKQARWGEALALLHKAQTLDPRSAPILQNLARMLVALRRYEELAKVNQVLMEVMGGAGTLLDAYSWAMTPYYAHGSTEAVETLVAGLTPAVRHTAANAIIVCGQWAYTKGDAAGLIRLWEEAGPDWHFSPVNERYDLISVASAFLKLGEASRARPLLEKNRELLVAQLATRPERIMAWDDLALTHAMLGEKAAALGMLSKIQTLAQQASTPPSPGQRLDLAQVYAWLGQKDQAVAELTAALHQPGPPEFGNVHVLRTAIIWWPLQGDPAFEALLNDPANNTPLL